MGTTTERLSHVLISPTDIRTVLEENEASITSPTLKEHLVSLLHQRGMTRLEVIRNAQLDSNYANQLFSGLRTKPGREQALSLAFGFGLNRKDADRLLRAAGVGALHPKNRRDAVIIHSLENGKTIAQTNEILISLGLDAFTGHRHT